MTRFPSTYSRRQVDLDPAGADNQMGGMDHHIITIRTILRKSLATVDQDAAWLRWSWKFCAEAAKEIVEIAGPDSNFKNTVDEISGDVWYPDAAPIAYALMKRFAPDHYEHLCDLLRIRLIRAFVAELDMSFPAWSETVGSDFARLVTNASLDMMIDCLQDASALSYHRAEGWTPNEPVHLWEHCTFTTLLNAIDPENEIRWLLKLTT